MQKRWLTLLTFACLLSGLTTLAISKDRKDVTLTPQDSSTEYKIDNTIIDDRAIPASYSQVLFFDDFESTPTWWPDASWNNTDYRDGKLFSFESGWTYVDDHSYSENHCWHNLDSLDLSMDFLISPVIQIPDSINLDGYWTGITGAHLSFYMDLDAPDDEELLVYLGTADALWDFSTDDPYSGTSSWYMDQEDNMMKQWLYTPAIDLSSTAAPKLTFYSKYNTEAHWDYLAVDVSMDMFRTYTCLDTFSGQSDTYTLYEYDLTPFAGSTVQCRFRYTADEFTIQEDAGWHVDDIQVADNGTVLFSDDGGDSGSSLMNKEGFIAGEEIASITDWGTSADEFWEQRRVLDIEIDGGSITDLDNARIAFRWMTDGDESQGRGIWIDDVTLLAWAANSWSGTSNQGQPVRFLTTADGAGVPTFYMKQNMNGAVVTQTVWVFPPSRVTDNTFSISQSGWSDSFTYAGEFTTETTAEGTWYHKTQVFAFPSWITLEGQGTWTATGGPLHEYIVGVEADCSPGIPERFALNQNYPNPFNPATHIQYEIPRSAHVEIIVLNAVGQKLVTLVDGQTEAGIHTLIWDSRDRSGNPVPSGVYFCQMKAEGIHQTRKMLLLR